jgi:hypothetical protein
LERNNFSEEGTKADMRTRYYYNKRDIKIIRYKNIMDSIGFFVSGYIIYFFYLVCEAICTTATHGLLCQPRVIEMIVEKQMECRLAGEIKVLEENLPQRHFCPSQNPT